MSDQKKCDGKNDNSRDENEYYKKKCKMLRRTVQENVFENAALCDEISETQKKLLIVQEECKFLLKKVKSFESKLGALGAKQPESTSVKKGTTKNNIFITPGAKQPNPTPVKKVTTKNKSLGTAEANQPEKTPVSKKTTKKNAIKKIEKKNITTNSAMKTVKSQPTKQVKQKLVRKIPEPIACGDLTIYNFGQIVYDTPFYYSPCAIYTPGYYATRTYAHFRNLFTRCTYHCKIIKAGTSPRFEITDHEKNFKVTGLSTDECHSHLISLINKMLGPVDLIAANGNGDRFFGICTATVRLKLQSASKSKFCTGYIPLESQDDVAEAIAEKDPSLSFESLHERLNKFQSKR